MSRFFKCGVAQKGGAEGSGTRSSLLWECRKAILQKKPRYILFENVKALVSRKFLPYFLKWQDELSSYGYSNFAKVLNARDYGVPQNRERIFMVSVLDENASYHFPEPFPLYKRLKDVLEEEVDERYYLSKKIIDTFIERNKINEDNGNGFKFEPTDSYVVEPFIPEPSEMIGVSVHPLSHKMEFKGAESIKSDASPTLRATDYKCPPTVWEIADMMLKRSEQSRGKELGVRVQENGNIRVYKNDGSGVSESYVTNADNIAQTNISSRPGLVYGFDYRIRKLTPREVFRLMDVDDADIDKIQAAGISNSQQYKMAGNSIVVSCLYHIFRKMFIDTRCESRQLELF